MKRLLVLSLLTNVVLGAVLVGFVSFFGGPRYFWFRLTHRAADGLSESRDDTFAAMPPRGRAMVMLGDSLIQNCEWHELFNDPLVLNRGISGQWSETLRGRLGHVVALQPRAVFLMTGINDLRAQGPERIAGTVRGIVRDLREGTPATQVYVHSVLPVNNHIHDTGRDNADITALNQRLRAQCPEIGCRFIDLHPLFEDADGRLREELSFDGVHLNGAAYRMWSKQLEPILAELRRTE